MSRYALCLLAVVAVACSSSSAPCGFGTHLDGGVCVADIVACGSGSRLEGGVCVSDGCGPGSSLNDAGLCVGDAGLIVLGTCGAGSQPSDAGTCFLVRVPVTDVPADGFSKIPILALGTQPDGTPSTDQVVLLLTDAAKGQIYPSDYVTLGPLGATTYLIPCDSATSPVCAGPTRVTLSLASAPTVVLAQSQEFQLTAPTGVGSAAPCLVGTNAVFFDGSDGDYIYPGIELITQAVWTPSVSPATGPEEVLIHLVPSDSTQGLWWDLDFTSLQLGLPLQAQVYTGAQRAAFAAPGHPGLEVTGDGRGCNMIDGSFQIETLSVDGGALEAFTATFLQNCDGAPPLHGCVAIVP